MASQKGTKKNRNKQLAGMPFGRWTVLDQSEMRLPPKLRSSGRKRYWLCRCKCGMERWVGEGPLMNGTSKGCVKCGGKQKRDLAGMKFGKWSVLGPKEFRDTHKATYWWCRCDCGTEKWVSNDELGGKRFSNNGCQSCRFTVDVSLPDGSRRCRTCLLAKPIGDFPTSNGNYKHECKVCKNKASVLRIRSTLESRCRKALQSAKARAKKNDVPFALTVADLLAIYPPDDCCPVLGRPFVHIGLSPMNRTLDRIRPALGYVVGNVAFISHRANVLKRDATAAELLAVAEWAEAAEKASPLAMSLC